VFESYYPVVVYRHSEVKALQTKLIANKKGLNYRSSLAIVEQLLACMESLHKSQDQVTGEMQRRDSRASGFT